MYNLMPPVPLTKGINGGMSEDSLEQGEVVDSQNFLFAKGEAFTRPGRDSATVTNADATSIFARSHWKDDGTPLVVMMATGKLFSLSAANVATEITGAGITFGSPEFHNSDMVNGVVLIGNHPAGVLRWDPTGGTYSVMTTARFRYVAAHLSRAVAAYKLTGSAGDPRTVGYSNSGDETDWTAGSAGSSLIVDSPDDITGLFVIKNIVGIARRTGFHLGYPTGISLPPFRFEAWNRRGIGVYYPSTLDYTDNVAIFAGEDDVYTNDLSSIKPIGFKIRDQLIPLLKAGVNYQGFISRHYTGKVRLQYHLFPQNPTNSLVQPHFVYDMYEDTWSKCSYADAKDIRAAFYRVSSNSYKTVAFVTSTGNLRHWDDSIASDTDGYLVTPTIPIADLGHDGRLDSILLKYRDEGLTGEIQVSSELMGQDSVYRSGSSKRSLGTEFAGRKWMRAIFPQNISGQMLSMRIDVPAGIRLSTNLMVPKIQSSGEFKGTAS